MNSLKIEITIIKKRVRLELLLTRFKTRLGNNKNLLFQQMYSVQRLMAWEGFSFTVIKIIS